MQCNHNTHDFKSDPNQSLPQELFCRRLSFIEPIPKASCNLVARSWNNAISSDPNTHKVIDLSRMKRENPLDLANRKDPHAALPEKVFISLLCSLPSSSIVSAAQVSKAWLGLVSRNTRRLGLSDLCCFADNRQLNRILSTFDRLSSLAQHKVVKVTLNLSSFYEDFRIWDLGLQEDEADEDSTIPFETTGLGRLLKALHDCTSLKEIHLQIDSNAVLEEDKNWHPIPPSSPFYMAFHILEVFMTFDQLDIVCITAPVDLTVQAEIRTPSFKSFSLIGNDEGKIFKANRSFVLPLLENVKTFLRSESANFTMYHLAFVGQEYEDQDEDWQDLGVISGWGESKILTLLSDSKSSLQSLDNSVSSNSDATAVWDFARECSNLTSLSLDLVGKDGSAHEEKTLSFPDHSLSLKKLKMKGDDSIHFNSMQRWAGDRVEELMLAYFTCAQDGLVSFLLQSRFTLKSIKIDRLRINYNLVALANLFSSNDLSFPNLESLILDTADLSLCRFFTMIDSPKLSTLEMDGYDWDRTTVRPDFNSFDKIFLDSFLSLLSRCNLSLINVKFRTGSSRKKGLSLLGPSLFFPRVQTLNINGHSPLETWLSKCKFPNLNDLSVEDYSLRKEFRRNSPGLLPIKRVYWLKSDPSSESEGDLELDTE